MAATTRADFKKIVIDQIETQLVALSEDDELTIPMVHYKRGIMFGLMASLAPLKLISDDERLDIIERVDNISKIKYREIDAVMKRVAQN